MHPGKGDYILILYMHGSLAFVEALTCPLCDLTQTIGLS